MVKHVCPECTKTTLTPHCGHCTWLFCATCLLLFGPRNAIFVGSAREQHERENKRRNGV